jgi:hypothetical protein
MLCQFGAIQAPIYIKKPTRVLEHISTNHMGNARNTGHKKVLHRDLRIDVSGEFIRRLAMRMPIRCLVHPNPTVLRGSYDSTVGK